MYEQDDSISCEMERFKTPVKNDLLHYNKYNFYGGSWKYKAVLILYPLKTIIPAVFGTFKLSNIFVLTIL